MSNWGFVVLSFALSWAVLLGYAALLLSRHQRARAALNAALQTAAEPGELELAPPLRETVTLTAVEVAQ